MRYFLLVLSFCLCVPAHAEMTIETVTLQHRNAAEVVNIILPMVAQGGSITSTGNKLFIKSTPDNIEQLRRMIADIDVAPKQLLITVSLDRDVLQQNSGGSARISVQGNPSLSIGDKSRSAADTSSEKQKDSRIKYDVRLFEQAHTQRTPQVQSMRVTEGLWATIKTGQAIPIATRTRNPDGTVTETYTYTAVASGFRVLPRVNGDTVTLTIRPQAQSPGAAGGAFNTTEMDTTVSGKLGKWIALGGVAESQHDKASGITYRTQERHDENNQIYVKVELLKQ